MIMIDAVIFDLDGVICPTDEFHFKAWKQVADEEHIYFDDEINNQLRGISREDCLNVILKRATKEYTDEEKQKLGDRKNEIYKSYLENLKPSDCSDSIRSTLLWLKKKELKIGLGSSSTNAEFILNKLGLENTFDAIVSGSDVENVKPSPDIFLLVSQKLGINPENTIVVEDAFAGVQAAKKGGFVSCGIKEAASYYLTDYPLKTVADVIMVVTKLNQIAKK
jgi:beta-phosphoglucomutase